MSDQTSPPGSDWRQQRREERVQRRQARWGGAWVGGVILIALGALLLAQNLGFSLPHNWWAAFLLIPAALSFASAWSAYHRSGRMTGAVRGGLIGGAVLVVLSGLFLIDFDWGKYWPVILILLGIAALTGGTWRR